MNAENLTTIEQVEQFLAGTQPVMFCVTSDKKTRDHAMQKSLVKFRYLSLGRREKGILTRYLIKISGYSHAQIKRLIRQYRRQGKLHLSYPQGTAKRFARQYTDEDIQLLAKMDAWHNTPSGPRLKKFCERADDVFGQTKYQRLAKISIAHVYNLRQSKPYRRRRCQFEKTRPKTVTIGVRRKPYPKGEPGYLRIDSVHQGDLDGYKGVYHINAVDEVTQCEIVVSVEKISEAYLIPALKSLLAQFPFVILGFHSDNGSEYINERVAELLEKLRIEFTQSRSRKTNDNALAEGKNAAVVRQCYGYAHIPQHFASTLNEFNQAHLNPYVNFHRPCFFPMIMTDDKGKQRKKYPYENLMTPYDKLKSLPNAKQYLKPHLSFDILDTIALKMSDNEAADQLQIARQKLFHLIHGRKVNA